MPDLFARLAELKAELGRINTAASKDALAVLSETAQRLARLIATSTNAEGTAVINEAHRARIMREVDAELRLMERRFAPAFRRFYTSQMRAHLTLLSTYSDLGLISPRKAAAARAALTGSARVGREAGFRTWVARFQDNGLRTSISDALGRAAQHGYSPHLLAADLVRIPEFQFANLPEVGPRGMRVFTMGGNLGEADALVRRAEVIARTESTNIANNLHQTWTQEAGLDKYINVNDVPVAKECIEANEQGSMTLEGWAVWNASNGKGGRPPRHPNCDSLLVAVPPGFEGTTGEAFTTEARQGARG
jgi:hypothetical protein